MSSGEMFPGRVRVETTYFNSFFTAIVTELMSILFLKILTSGTIRQLRRSSSILFRAKTFLQFARRFLADQIPYFAELEATVVTDPEPLKK